MSGKKKKKKLEIKYSDIALNIIPFIDVFSMLTTFLLMTAVFTALGIIEVQIPFLTTAPPEKKDTERSLDVKVDMEKDWVEVTAAFTMPPINENKKKFMTNVKTWDKDLHKFMVEVKKMDPTANSVQLFTEDDVILKNITKTLDAVKLRLNTDQQFPVKAGASPGQIAEAREFLFKKVVMASVIL